MARVTIKKVNERIAKYGFELLRGNGYYYFSRAASGSPTINMDGIYGTPNLNAWTLEQLEELLVFRIIDDAPYGSSNLYVARAREYLQKMYAEINKDNTGVQHEHQTEC